MNTIPLNLVNSFIVFNESNNITEAATSLGITQPALSKQLMLLESLLGESVFLLRGRKKILTPLGKDLHLRLKDKIGNVQEVIQYTKMRHLDQTLATIKIAGRRGVLDRISGKIKFDGSLVFMEASNDKTIESVQNMKAEIGIMHSPPNTYELIAKPLFKEDFQITIPKKFLTQKPSYGKALFAQLLKYPCLGYRPEDEIIREACGYTDSEFKGLKMVRATENYASLAEMVRAQWGWAVLPSYLSASDKISWKVSVPKRIIPYRQFFVLYRPEFATNPWFKKLIIEIQSCF